MQQAHNDGSTGFGWYEALPAGIERVIHRVDPLRQSVSWFVHRLPAETGTMTDFSQDPVISLEVNPCGDVERRIDSRRERATLGSDTLTLTPAMTACEWRWQGQPFDILDVY